MQRSADVVIVGSGVCGALVAARLAARGVKVLILEAGSRVSRPAALAQYHAALIKVPECAYPNLPYAPHSTSDRPDSYYVHGGPDKFEATYLRQVGGTTWHWLGTSLRFIPDDFRLRSQFGVGVDWPISYEDLEPWYCAAEHELGVAGDPDARLDAPRSRPYPLPAIPLSYLDQRVAAAVARLGYTIEPTPQARNSQPYQNRPACCGSSSCIPICPVQAKYDATGHITQAERSGAELIDQAIASAVEIGADGRVSGIRYKRPDASEARATAKVYVIAAHGIETPKLLLQSRTAERPHGVANSSDQVGRNLMDHPTRLSWAADRGTTISIPRSALDRRDRIDARVATGARSMAPSACSFRIVDGNGRWARRITPCASSPNGGCAARTSHRRLRTIANANWVWRRWWNSYRRQRIASSQTMTSAMPSGFRVRASLTALTTTAVARSTVASACTRRSSRR